MIKILKELTHLEKVIEKTMERHPEDESYYKRLTKGIDTIKPLIIRQVTFNYMEEKMKNKFNFKHFNSWCARLGYDPNSIKSVQKYKKWTSLAGRLLNA